MNKYEEAARKLHKEGHNCSYSMYNAFKDDFNLNSDYPAPRSIDGKCGVILTSEKILKDIGREDLIPIYEERFIKTFGYLKCGELIRNGRVCDDNIGIGSRILDELLKEEK